MKGNENGIRVALATCHDKRNFGSMLQAWALQRYLALMGYGVRTIDKAGLSGEISAGRREHYARHAFDLPMYAEKAPFALHRARQVVDSSFRRKMAKRKAAFDAFAHSHFDLTRRPFSFEEARELSSEYDVVLLGSDQLWLPVNIAGKYYTLSWADPSVRKVSYATSFGLSELDERTLNHVRDFLSSYHAVSVRENSGADIIEQTMGERPEVVCDPTMLLEADEWEAAMNTDYEGLPDKPYVLSYLMGRSVWHRKEVRRYARENNLAVVTIAHNDSYVGADDNGADIYPWDAGPAEWLALIRNAALVCTDSFHATVFSNLFRVPYVSLRRHATGTAQSTNSRLDTLLGVLGHVGRLCEDAESFEGIANSTVDFESSRCGIDKLRNSSATWLNNALYIEGHKLSRHIEVFHKEECCGCAACANACPVGCVNMVFDVEGCEYPEVDAARCVGCSKCISACPVIDATREEEKEQRAFLVQHRDPKVLAESTSGGAFTALAQAVLLNGGVVFGAGWDRDGAAHYDAKLNACHLFVEEEAELWRFRNSKYAQSEIGESYKRVRAYLREGREVLFSGTPCQCEGLISFLGEKPYGLVVVDVVCRAVPTRITLKAYLKWLELKTGSDVTNVLFRDKARFGYEYSNLVAFKKEDHKGSKRIYSSGVESDPYLRAFFADICNRPSCYVCRFKKRYRKSDITLWDCFDVCDLAPELDDNRGVTRVLVHSKNGADLLDAASTNSHVVSVDAEQAVRGVREITQSVDVNAKRSAFLTDATRLDEMRLFGKWFPDSMPIKVERLVREGCERLGIYYPAKRAFKRLLGR